MWCMIALSLVSCASINPTDDETAPYRLSLWNDVPQLSRESGPPGQGVLVGTATGSEEKLADQGAPGDKAEGPLAVYGRELIANVRKTYTGERGLFYRLGWVPFREASRRSADLQLFVQVITREEEKPRGTVFLFHGYANDSSHMTGVAGALLEKNWAVVLVDLPGHGLSTGLRGDVATFSDYGDAVQTVLNCVKSLYIDELPRPFMAFGHSTGALALVDYSIRYTNEFSRMVFYAPLIRSAWWNTARIGRTVLGPFVKTAKATSKSALGLRVFPVHWFDELVRWEAWARKHGRILMPPTRIIQPVHDEVVLSDYNARFLQQRAPETELLRIDGLSHFTTDARIPDGRLLKAIVSYFE